MRIIDAPSTVPQVASKYKWVHVSNEIFFASCDICASDWSSSCCTCCPGTWLQLVLPELAQFGRRGSLRYVIEGGAISMLSVEFRTADIRQQCCRHRPQVVLKCRCRYQLLELWRLLCKNRWRWQLGTPVGSECPVAGSDGAPVLLPSLLSSTSPNGYRNTALEVWYLRLRPRYIDRIFHCRIQSNSNWRFGQRWLYRRTSWQRRNNQVQEHSMTTRPIQWRKSLDCGQCLFAWWNHCGWNKQTTDLNLSNSLVKESIEFTMGVNKFQKLYVIN